MRTRSAEAVRLAGVCILLTMCACLAAADQPVRMRLEPLSIRGRSGGGIPVQIKLEYNQAPLLEGELYLRVFHGVPASNREVSEDELITTIRYEGIVLQGTDYIFQTMLPPIEHASQGQYDIQAWFETASASIPLTTDPRQLEPPEPHELLSVSQFERSTVICSCSGSIDYQRPSGNRRFLNDVLSLANYHPLSSDSEQSNQYSGIGERTRQIQYHPAAYDVRNLPEDPLALCSFDLVLLADGSLGRLDAFQMSALKTWVQAGGSLCIVPDDLRLDASHVGFLQELIQTQQAPDINLTLTDEGRLLVISEQESPIVLRQVGLGRVALLPAVDDLSQRLSAAETGQLVGFLWKVRSDSPVHDGGNWGPTDIEKTLAEQGLRIARDDRGFFVAPNGEDTAARRSYEYGMRFTTAEEAVRNLGITTELHPESNTLVEACWEALMPSGVEMVPTWVIAVILLAYVLTIGPVDYFVLGYWRKRKYTWIVFPVVTLFYTGMTVYIANRYMATTETGSWLAITDVIDDGHPVRTSTLKMHFFGTHRTVEENVSRELAVPAVMMDFTDQRFNPSMQPATPTGRRNTVLNYAGRFPQSYVISQSMQQWSPKMVRRLTLSPDVETVPKIPWADSSLLTSPDGRNRLTNALNELNSESGRIVGAVVLNGQRQFALNVGDRMFDSRHVQSGEAYLSASNQGYYYTSRPIRTALLAAGLIRSTWSPAERMFQIVSQIAPQGSASCEDLPIMDVSDKNQWALIIVQESGSGYRAFRKVYHVKDLPPEKVEAN